MEELIQQFREKGWFVWDFDNPSPVLLARTFLEKELEKTFGKKIALEDYHLCGLNDAEHTHLQIKMTQVFREKQCGPNILKGQQAFFCSLLGPDFYVQANPYLRMTRPHKPQDNIGYHRDTFYGGSPYELSVFVPFVDLPAECSLSVLPGSHVHSEQLYPTTQIENPDKDVRKGTQKHQLGFLYAPKVMESNITAKMEAVPLKVGQALIFCLSTVHGSVVNTGTITRWSSDMRVMNAMAPVDLSETRPDYYLLASQSVVTECAKKYFYANGKETRDNVQLELCHTAS